MKHNPRVDAMLPSCTLIHMTILHIDAEQLTLMQCTIQLTLMQNIVDTDAVHNIADTDAEQLTLMPCTMTPSCTLILLPLLVPS